MGRKKLRTSDQMFRVLERFVLERGYAPTIKEYQCAMGIGSSRTAMRYLVQLEDEGKIERWHGARGIRLMRNSETLKYSGRKIRFKYFGIREGTIVLVEPRNRETRRVWIKMAPKDGDRAMVGIIVTQKELELVRADEHTTSWAMT